MSFANADGQQKTLGTQEDDNAAPITRNYANGTPFPEMVHPATGIRDANDKPSSGSRLSVASFNLLAPCYVRPRDNRTGGVQAFASYDWVKDDNGQVLEMAWRGPRLLEALQKSRADVLCLQELQLERGEEKKRDYKLPEWIRPIAEDDVYEACLPPKRLLEEMADRNKRALGVDAPVTNALLYRTDRLILYNSSKKKSKKKKDGGTTTCISACFGGIASLRGMEPVCVTSVHLDATNEAKRVKQIAGCLEMAKTLLSSARYLSTIIAGDFNTAMHSGSCVANFLSADGLCSSSCDNVQEMELIRQCRYANRVKEDETLLEENMEKWRALHSHARKTVEDYCVALSRVDTGYTRTVYGRSEDGDLNTNEGILSSNPTTKNTRKLFQTRPDHILHTARTLRPVAAWSTLEADPESCRLGLPNRRCPSDHLPIGAVFEVLKPPSILESDRVCLLSIMTALQERQKATTMELEVAWDTELDKIEHQSGPKKRSKGKGKTKKGSQKSPKIMECLQKRSEALKMLNTKQRAQGLNFVQGLNDLERIALEEHFEYSVSRWVETG